MTLVQQVDSDDPTDWFHAVEARDVTAVYSLIGRFLGARNAAGNTALIAAVRARDVQVAALLLPFECALLDAQGLPALVSAIDVDDHRLVSLLAPLEYEVPLPGYESCLEYAVARGSSRAASILVTFVDDSPHASALRRALMSRNEELVSLLLQTQPYLVSTLQRLLDLDLDEPYRHCLEAAATFSVEGGALRLTDILAAHMKCRVDQDRLSHVTASVLQKVHSLHEIVRDIDFPAVLLDLPEDLEPEPDPVPLPISSQETSLFENHPLPNSVMDDSFLPERPSSMSQIYGDRSDIFHNDVGTPPTMASLSLRQSEDIGVEVTELPPAKEKKTMTAAMTALREMRERLLGITSTLQTASAIIFGSQTDIPENGVTPLMRAVSAGKDIIGLIGPWMGMQDADGHSALMLAADVKDSLSVRCLFRGEFGLKDCEGKTATRHLIDSGCLDLAQLILAYEEDNGLLQTETGHTGIDGMTCLGAAIIGGLHSLVTVLATREWQLPVSFDASGFGRIIGGTPLMLAAVVNNTHAILRLSDALAGQSEPATRRTALMLAARIGNLEATLLLLSHEAGLQDFQGWSALMYAAEAGHTKIVEVLLEHEARLVTNTRCGWGSGKTALMIAATNNRIGPVSILRTVEGGMTQPEGRYAGWSALMCAAASCAASPECVSLLAECEGHDFAARALRVVPGAHPRRSETIAILSQFVGPRPSSGRRSRSLRSRGRGH
ncbi:Ankyrin repeat protein 1 [Giardia muris]|uniref:Ankyrin repeat protein 1 n=1 Tax=Giardia muris TaxID=5742 RepID=A0A4Z1SY50_GIAMU|nr:Ankyrin repeat protein 1 [Giardia muris]|eukprot:TNJ28438.1 Ankyrin repeat protein 1 [Giardia muris]